MAEECFIGIDQGSSATKAVVVSAAGQVLFQTRKDLSPLIRDSTRIEQDPHEVLDSVQQVINESVQAVHGTGMSVLGIGLSCQRSSCLVWNEAAREPLSPIISWRDRRGTDIIAGMEDRGPAVFKTTGLPLTPYYSASKFRWLRDNLPAAQQPGALYGTLSSFLIQRLTGSAQAVIDHTNAARTLLMNIHSLSWDQELLALFGLVGAGLPLITPTARVFGTIRTPGGPVPLLACVGDQQASLLGLGVLEQGDAGINYGTGGFLMVNTGTELALTQGLMASVLYSTEQERRYLLEGSVNAAGDALEWLRNSLGLFSAYAEVDDLCWKASSDVVAFVGINGTGAPHWESSISSAIHGLTIESVPADVVRAVIENIAFFIKDIEEAMRAAGNSPASCALSGGLSSLSYLAQIQADILGKDVVVSAVPEASAMGAAFLAGMQEGTWNAADIRRMTEGGEQVHGEPNPGLEKRYRRWKELHRSAQEIDGVY